MIKFADQVPSVYPSASRDFQFICWLMDIVLNSVKHNVDDLYALPNSTADPKLTELLATTLGFKIKRNYDQTQLRALVVALPRILKYKGTKTAVDMAGEALLAASGAIGSFSSTVENGELCVTLPKTLVDLALLTDLLPYILPAGMTCRMKRTGEIDTTSTNSYDYSDKLFAEWHSDLTWDDSTQMISGLATLFDPSVNSPAFSNFRAEGILNSGLLDNSVIPVLENQIVYNPSPLAEPDYTEKPNDYDTTVILDKYSVEESADGDTVITGEK